MNLNQTKIVDMLERVPYRFWVIITLSLGVGLISIIGQRVYDASGIMREKSDYPFYEKVVSENNASQVPFYKTMVGAWYVTQDTTELVVEFYDDGYFSIDSVDEKASFARLFAAGRYVQTKDGTLLLSQMRELGFPFHRKSAGVTFHYLKVNETFFDAKIVSKGPNKKHLTLYFSDKNIEDIHPAFKAFFDVLAQNEGVLTLRYLGSPVARDIQ